MPGRSGSAAPIAASRVATPRLGSARPPRRSVCTAPTKRKPFARDGADQRLRAAAVADRLARGIDPAGQGQLGDMPPLPDLVDQFVLADHAIAVFHQMDDEIEHLRLQRDRHVLPAQLPRVGIKYLICKEKLHPVVRPQRKTQEILKRNCDSILKHTAHPCVC